MNGQPKVSLPVALLFRANLAVVNATVNDQRFPSTHWSLIQQICDGQGTDASQDALEIVCRKYWAPVFGFVRRRGKPAADAEDVTQGFFQQLLEGRLLEKADANQGRLRTFLLRLLKNYVSQEHQRNAALKRGGAIEFSSLEAEDALNEVLADQSLGAEEVFERQWAAEVLELTLGKLHDEYVEKDRGAMFETLRPFLADPDAANPETCAAQLGMSVNAVRIAVHRLRKRYRVLIREEIRQTIGPEDDVDEELRYLATLLRSRN